MSTTQPTHDTQQVTFAKQRADGLRAMADLIDQNPELAGSEYVPLRLLVPASDADEMSRLVRQLGGARAKEATNDYLTVVRELGGQVGLEVYAQRQKVCEAVVVGSETVEVPDPNAPKVVIERDVVEWRCAPVLTSTLGLADSRASLNGAA